MMIARRSSDERQLGFDFASHPANDVLGLAKAAVPDPCPKTPRLRILTIDGERITTSQASQRYGIPRQRLNARLRQGWSDVDAVTVPAWVHHARVSVQAGHPSSASWDRDPWSDDDHAWYVVACHPDGLSLEQVAALMGVTDERVRQIEQEAFAKIREMLGDPMKERPQWVLDVIGEVRGLVGDGEGSDED
jgi:hypothetical protein